MTESEAEKRMAQNEVAFREANQRIQTGFDTLKAIALEENEPHDDFDYDMPLSFLCECSDENCRKRLSLRLHEYNKAREISKKCFVVAKDHDVPKIEEIIESHETYSIVAKHIAVPQHAHGLKSTPIDNVAT